jgi:ribonuclease P protein component
VVVSPDGATLSGIKTLTGKAQFGLVYEKGRSRAVKEVVIKALPNGLETTRYGLAVSRRVGKAVVRNRVKRRLREILRKLNLMPGQDIILIARNAAAAADYATLGRSVEKALAKAGLLTGEHEGDSPGVD